MFQIKVSEVILQTPDLLARRDQFGVYYLTVDPTNPKVFDLLFGKDLCPELATPFLNVIYGPGQIKPNFTTELAPQDDSGQRCQGSLLSLQDYTRKHHVLVMIQCPEHMYRESWKKEGERILKLRHSFITEGIAEYLFVFFSKDEQDLDGEDRSEQIFQDVQFGIQPSDVRIMAAYFPNRVTAAVEPETIKLLNEKCGIDPEISLDRLNQALNEPFDVCYRDRTISENYCGALDKIFDSFQQSRRDPSQHMVNFIRQMNLMQAALDPDALYLYLADKARMMDPN